MDAHRLFTHAERLRELHGSDELLVLPNVWDVASARVVASAGFPVLATASAAVTASLGHPDDNSIPPAEMLAAVGRVAATADLPVTADLEAGYGLEPEQLVAVLLGAGAVGLNLEDTDHAGGGLVDAGAQAERHVAVKAAGRAAGVDVVLNARVDASPQRQGEGWLDEAINRARLYREAGADCAYPIALAEPADVETFVSAVGGAVNFLVRPGSPPLPALRDLGVARVSLGPGLQRVVLAAIERFLGRIDPESPDPVYR
jgi:2-methylisocitrate lyase-like PEP mutase family enzyme